jgi:hypothetical protein
VTHRARSIGLAAALACGFATSAAAEVRIDGTAAALHVTTGRDSIATVLTAFGASHKLRYRAAVPLDAAANAVYSGSLGQVLARLLDGYNFIVKRDQDGIEVVVLGRRGDVAIPPAPPPPRPPKGVVSRWR